MSIETALVVTVRMIIDPQSALEPLKQSVGELRPRTALFHNLLRRSLQCFVELLSAHLLWVLDIVPRLNDSLHL